MEQFDFVVTTIQKVTVQADTEDNAREWLKQQLPLNAKIERIIDVDYSDEELEYTMRNPIEPLPIDNVAYEVISEVDAD